MPLTARFLPPAPAPGSPGSPGLFGPGSAAWRVGRERVLLAGGPAALLLQLAHPLVAAGVAAHSDFTEDPLRRLRGTLDAVLTVTFGDVEQAHAAARRVGSRHAPVHGQLDAPIGRFAAGTAYRAGDPDLALWVLMTLAWTAVRVTETFVRPVPHDERDAYWADMATLGRLFGVSASGLPVDYQGMADHLEALVLTTLAVTPTSVELARRILTPEPPVVVAPLRPAPSVLAAGLLPAALREAYGLAWGPGERATWAAGRALTRAGLPVLPTRARYWPHYLVARARLDG